MFFEGDVSRRSGLDWLGIGSEGFKGSINAYVQILI